MPIGQATLDFGTGNVEASVNVTGQVDILATSKVEAWLRLVATASHSVDEVRIEPLKITAGNMVSGTGFTIYGECLNGEASGAYTVDWVWR